jgi:hypothetical protein
VLRPSSGRRHGAALAKEKKKPAAGATGSRSRGQIHHDRGIEVAGVGEAVNAAFAWPPFWLAGVAPLAK